MNKKYIGLLVLGSLSAAFALTTVSLVPTGVGTYSAWTPSTGTTHYTLVDESACNGTTDYVSTGTVGARDSYAVSLAGIPDGSTITGVSLTPCASRAVSTKAATVSVFYRLNGANSADSAAYSLSGTTPVDLAATNYSGLSVVKGTSTTFETGVVLVSGTSGARLSRLAAVVTYSAPVTIPADPSNATSSVMTAGTSTYAHISWTDNSSNELGFALEKGTDGINFAQFATTTANATSSNDFSVATGTTYYYRLRAFNSAGFSGYSNTTSVVIP